MKLPLDLLLHAKFIPASFNDRKDQLIFCLVYLFNRLKFKKGILVTFFSVWFATSLIRKLISALENEEVCIKSAQPICLSYVYQFKA